jgi:AcrR family transcriptional regulator
MKKPTRELVQERAQVTRDSLLTAAIALFAERGYDAIGTREIETAAGVKRGLITYHFGSKEALRESGDGDAVRKPRRRPGARARRIEWSRSADAIGERDPRIRAPQCGAAGGNRIMVQEGKHDDWRLAWIVDRLVKPYYALSKRL